jgi:hypothetical protein
MAKTKMLPQIGSLIFLVGIIIALLVGVYHASTLEAEINGDLDPDEKTFFETETGATVAWILAIFGTIVGILAALGMGTITSKETQGFLLAGIALVVMGGVFSTTIITYQLTPWLGSLLSGISLSLSIFVAPTVGILAIKEIWDLGKDV